MSILSKEKFSEDDRRNLSFTVVNALREAINIATRKEVPVPYETVLDILAEVSKEVYLESTGLIKSKNENDTVRLLKEKSEAQTKITRKTVSPQEIARKELQELEQMIEVAEDRDSLETEKLKLLRAIEHFEPRRARENKILQHDYSLNDRENYFNSEVVKESAYYKDYSVNGADTRIFRIRLIHTEKLEEILGADFIYEYFDADARTIRFVMLQYKIWKEKSLNIATGNGLQQCQKMKQHLCDKNMCKEKNTPLDDDEQVFRFPFCTGFLRPTSEMINPNSPMKSIGLHIPICRALKIQHKEGKLTKSNMKGKAIDQKVFEGMFIEGNIGSRELPIDEYERFYKQMHEVPEDVNFRVYVSEYNKMKEEKKYSKRE